MATCIICNEFDGKLIRLTDRGVNSIIEFSKLRNDHHIPEKLKENQESFVHEECRKWYNNRKRIASSKKELLPKKTRLSITSFDWKNNCFFCSKPVNHKSEWHMAETLTLKTTILKNCDDRIFNDSSDAWALEIKGRVNDCIDFVASEARYHQNCRALFSSGRQLVGDKSSGRPANNNLKNAFEMACEDLEDDP